MQNRRAIMLSLGMLLEKVDANIFMMKMRAKAKEENPAFEFTPQILGQAFIWSEQFNQKKLAKNDYKANILKVLGITKMADDEFWKGWNSMVVVGDIAARVNELREFCSENNALIYLDSDTNEVHAEAIMQEVQAKGIPFYKTGSTPAVYFLEEYPIYTTCELGKNRSDLTKYVVTEIKNKEFNKPSEIIRILGNPDNIKNPQQQAFARKECDALTAWCNDNGVTVKLHNNVNTLKETLAQIAGKENTQASEPIKLAM
jgi:hypothetical protein